MVWSQNIANSGTSGAPPPLPSKALFRQPNTSSSQWGWRPLSVLNYSLSIPTQNASRKLSAFVLEGCCFDLLASENWASNCLEVFSIAKRDLWMWSKAVKTSKYPFNSFEGLDAKVDCLAKVLWTVPDKEVDIVTLCVCVCHLWHLTLTGMQSVPLPIKLLWWK